MGKMNRGDGPGQKKGKEWDGAGNYAQDPKENRKDFLIS
jgi:hypothetical protein